MCALLRCLVLLSLLFQQRAAAELRICDGSSDACSSDLLRGLKFTGTSICAMPSAFSSLARASLARPTIMQSSSCSKLFSSSVSSDFVNCPPWRHEELTPSLVGSVRLWFERRADRKRVV